MPRLVPSFGLIKAMRLKFFPLDPAAKSAREFISQAESSRLRATNPNVKLATDVLAAPAPATLSLTFLNDEKTDLPIGALSVNGIFEHIDKWNSALARKGFVSDVDKQKLKDMDT